MTAILQGVRILEVAERTFVPAASALRSDSRPPDHQPDPVGEHA